MTLYENDLTPAVYNALRESVGWTPHPADRAATARFLDGHDWPNFVQRLTALLSDKS